MHIDASGKHSLQIEQFCHPPGMSAVRIGKDILGGGDAIQRLAQLRLRVQERFQGDVVDVSQVIVHVHLVVGLQAAQGCPVFLKITLAYSFRYPPQRIPCAPANSY